MPDGPGTGLNLYVDAGVSVKASRHDGTVRLIGVLHFRCFASAPCQYMAREG